MRTTTMVRRLMLSAAIVLAVAMPARAQAAQLAWTAPIEAQTAGEAAGFLYTLYINSGATTPPPPVVVTGVTCTGTVPGAFACVAPIPAAVPIVIGTRLELSAKTPNSNESPRSVPFLLSPSAPTSLRRQ